MSLIGERLRSHWLAHDIEPAPGVPEERLRDFETRFGVTFPPEMRDYLLLVDGMGSRSESDDAWFSFWPLSDFQRADEAYEGFEAYEGLMIEDLASYFIFADHALELPAFAIQLNPSATPPHSVIAISVHQGEYSAFAVALSFGEFVEKYLDENARFDLLVV